MLTICSIRASSRDDKGGAGGGGEEEDGESPSALLILSGSAAIICSANVSTLASSSPIKRNHHPSQTRKTYYRTAEITLITTSRIFCSLFFICSFFYFKAVNVFLRWTKSDVNKTCNTKYCGLFRFYIYIYICSGDLYMTRIERLQTGKSDGERRRFSQLVECSVLRVIWRNPWYFDNMCFPDLAQLCKSRVLV